MSGEELIDRFEADSLPEDSLHHADHVRLAYAYLARYPALEALDRFSRALKGYAAARGHAQRYSETITYAYFFLIRERMGRSGAVDWDEFARRNPDLFLSKNGILARYYQEATLQSDVARTLFLFPDQRYSSHEDEKREPARAR